MTDLPSFAAAGNVKEILGNVVGSELVGTAVTTKVTFTSNIPANIPVVWDGNIRPVKTVEATVNTSGDILRNGDTVRLLANDPGLNVSGIQWKCTIGGLKTIVFDAKNDGEELNLATVVPVVGVPAIGIIAKGDPVDDVQSALGDTAAQFYVKGQPIGDPLVLPSAAWGSVIGKPFVPLKEFDPDADFDAALAAAIDAADAAGFMVQFEPNKTYTANTLTTITDKHVRIDFNGSKILRGTAAPNTILALNFSHSTIQSVVGLTTNTFTPDWPTTLGVTTKVSRIQLASTAGWAAGDYAVIVSDDKIPWGEGNDTTLGERFKVAAVAGNYLYSAHPLRLPFTTNIRIARMTQRDCVLRDAWIEDEDPSAPRTNPQGAITIDGAVGPQIINWHVANLLGRGMMTRGCVDGRVTGGEINNLRTDSSESAYGYGIDLMSSNDFRISGVNASYVRHAITTNAIDGVRTSVFAPTRNNLFNYGGSLGHRIFGCSGSETGSSVYDLHPDAYGCVIDGVHVGWNHVEEEGQSCAFQLRGHQNEIRNSSSIGIGGVHVAAGTAATSLVHRISNYEHTLLSTDSSAVGIKADYGDMASGRGTLELSNVSIIARDCLYNLFELNQATVNADRLDLVQQITAASTSAYPFVLTDTALAIDTLTIDLTGTDPTSGPYLFYFNDSTCSVVVNRLVVKTGGSVPWTLCNFNNTNGSLKIGRIETDRLPSSGLVDLPGGSATYSIGEIVLNQQALSDTVTTVTGSTTNLSTAAGIQVFDSGLGANRTVTEATVNLRVGRQILYVRTTNATGAFTWTIGSDVLTTPGTWLRREWNGTAWFTVGKGTTTNNLIVTQSGVVELHNQADQATNFEKLVLRYASNIAELGNLAGGTGTLRTLRIGAASSAGAGNISRYAEFGSAPPYVAFHANTSANGTLFSAMGDGTSELAAASGNQCSFGVEPIVSQSGTAGYTGLLVNPTENSTGSGAKKLLDLQVGGSSKVSVNNVGVVRFAQFATGSRPTAASAGAGGCIYDTTLSKPIWSDGTTWRDAAGTSV